MCPAQFSGDRPGSWLWHAVSWNLHATARESRLWFVAPGREIFSYIYREMIVRQDLFLRASGCVQGTVICVNSIFQLLCLFFPPLSSQLWCYEQWGEIKVVEIHATKPWDAVEFLSVSVNNGETYTSAAPHYGSSGVAKQPACCTEECIIMKVIYYN